MYLVHDASPCCGAAGRWAAPHRRLPAMMLCLSSTRSWAGTQRKLGIKIIFLCFKWISPWHFVTPAPPNSSARSRVAFPHALHVSSSLVGCLGTPAGSHGDVCLKILPGVGSFLTFPLLKVTWCFIKNLDDVTKTWLYIQAGAVKDYIKMLLQNESLKFLVFAHHLTMLQACTEAVIENKVLWYFFIK